MEKINPITQVNIFLGKNPNRYDNTDLIICRTLLAMLSLKNLLRYDAANKNEKLDDCYKLPFLVINRTNNPSDISTLEKFRINEINPNTPKNAELFETIKNNINSDLDALKEKISTRPQGPTKEQIEQLDRREKIKKPLENETEALKKSAFFQFVLFFNEEVNIARGEVLIAQQQALNAKKLGPKKGSKREATIKKRNDTLAAFFKKKKELQKKLSQEKITTTMVFNKLKLEQLITVSKQSLDQYLRELEEVVTAIKANGMTNEFWQIAASQWDQTFIKLAIDNFDLVKVTMQSLAIYQFSNE